MNTLRERMTRDMQLRRLAPNTQRVYLKGVAGLTVTGGGRVSSGRRETVRPASHLPGSRDSVRPAAVIADSFMN